MSADSVDWAAATPAPTWPMPLSFFRGEVGMIERSYTVTEIIRMRKAVSTLLTFFTFGPLASEQSARIEDQLRTYMTAGVHPDDLETAAREHEVVQWRAVERTIPGGFGA